MVKTIDDLARNMEAVLRGRIPSVNIAISFAPLSSFSPGNDRQVAIDYTPQVKLLNSQMSSYREQVLQGEETPEQIMRRRTDYVCAELSARGLDARIDDSYKIIVVKQGTGIWQTINTQSRMPLA